MGGLLGSFHELELPFVFGYLDDPMATVITGDEPHRDVLAKRLQTAWTAFAHGNGPLLDETTSWPRYERNQRATMVLDIECSRRDAPLDDERRVWEEILPSGSG
jgi:para-nitrobenzyl esterase